MKNFALGVLALAVSSITLLFLNGNAHAWFDHPLPACQPLSGLQSNWLNNLKSDPRYDEEKTGYILFNRDWSWPGNPYLQVDWDVTDYLVPSMHSLHFDYVPSASEYILNAPDINANGYVINSDGSLRLVENNRGGYYDLNCIHSIKNVGTSAAFDDAYGSSQLVSVKTPLFLVSNSLDGKTNNLTAQLDQNAYLNVNGHSTPLPDFIDIRLFKQGDLQQRIPSNNEDIFFGLGLSQWDNLENGEYRIIATSLITENSELYNFVPFVLDFRLDGKNLIFSYNEDTQDYCFTNQDLRSVDNFTTDPNTGSWLTPGSIPQRCLTQEDLEKTPDSAFGVGYDFSELPECDTLDLACHLSRFLNRLFSWILGTINWLFIPNPTAISTAFFAMLDQIKTSLGFLSNSLNFITQFFESIIDVDNNATGDTCNIGDFSVFGSAPASIHLCRWRYQLPELWSMMRVAIQGGIIVSFSLAYYSKFLDFFGRDVDGHILEDE